MATSVLHIKTEVECKVFLFDEEKGIATPDKYFNLEVRMGEQDLHFVSTGNHSFCCNLLFSIGKSDTDNSITIKESMFHSITKIDNSDISSGIVDEENVLYSHDGKYLIRCYNCGVEQYEIKQSCKVICDYAFSSCRKLSTVKLPSDLKYIGDNAFEGCVNLTEVCLPQNLIHIGNRSFYHCSNLSHINIPENLKQIGDEPFLITNIKNVDCNSSQFLYVNGCLIDRKDKRVITCFSDESNVKLISGITRIGKSAFRGCKITKIAIPQGVTHIDDSAFEFCEELSDIILPDSLISIGSNTFSSCYKLSDIYLPASLSSIGNAAFTVKVYMSSKLCSIHSALFKEKGVKEGEPLVFEPLSHIYVPKGTETKFKQLLPDTLYSKLIEADGG